MHIQKINCYYNEKQKQQNYRNHKVTFKNHPDFIRLQKQYQITASSYFRRGPYYGSANDNFQNIINVFQTIFDKNIKQPIKMLIVGIGDSQEPFSYLAVIQDIIKNKKLSDVLELHIIDLQSKPCQNKLFKNSYFEYSHEPNFAPSSFVKDYQEKIHLNAYPGYYRVNDEIFDFLAKTYDDPKKSLWETRVQEAVKNSQENYDIISINNTLGYILKNERNQTMQNLCRMLKQDGILITDPEAEHLKNAQIEKSFKQLYEGIYLKNI
jgi:chemotaxis methyl-accepting protein methylase